MSTPKKWQITHWLAPGTTIVCPKLGRKRWVDFILGLQTMKLKRVFLPPQDQNWNEGEAKKEKDIYDQIRKRVMMRDKQDIDQETKVKPSSMKSMPQIRRKKEGEWKTKRWKEEDEKMPQKSSTMQDMKFWLRSQTSDVY